jgi:cyanate permease
MIRALLLLTGFILISDDLRAMFMGVVQYLERLVNAHTTIAFALTGLLCFCSVLFLKLTERKS